MIASFMAQLIFRGEFRVTWGTVCHQDAFATVLVGPPHAFQSTSGTNTRRALRRRLSRFGSCSIIYVCKPTRDPKAWRSPSIASCTCASHMNVIAPPHPTQTPYLKSSTTTGAVFHPLAYTCRYIHGIHAWYMLHCVVSEYLHTSEYIYIIIYRYTNAICLDTTKYFPASFYTWTLPRATCRCSARKCARYDA